MSECMQGGRESIGNVITLRINHAKLFLLVN